MSECKCVFDTAAMMEEVANWLCANNAAKCTELAAAGKAATQSIVMLNEHRSDSSSFVTTENGATVKPFWMVVMDQDAGDYGSEGALYNGISTVNTALASLPSSTITDETNFDEVVKFAKAQSDATRTNASVSSIRGTIQDLQGAFSTGKVNQDSVGSFNSVGNIASKLEKELNTLRDLQKEYEKLNKNVSDSHADRLAELQAKARACSDGDAAKCPGGQLSDEERAELSRLINAKGAGISGAGQLGTVGAVIASTQEPTKRTFKEQCLLLSNIVHFVEYRDTYLYGTPKGKKRKPYRDFVGTSGSINANACLMADREPWGFMNQLVQDPSFNPLFNIETKYLSHLQPMIRLYKIVTDSSEDGTKEFEQEVTFEAAYNENFDGVLKSSDKRGFGVGIRDFTFSYEGSDPFAVKKSIKARLSIFASSFDDLLKPRDGYRYADLALKTGTDTKFAANVFGNCNDEIVGADLSKFNFRLKAVVGWAMPNSVPGISDRDRGELTRAINNSFVTLNLTPTIHEFEIGEDGRVLFNINYLAYVDQFFDEAAFNIFSDPDISANIFKRRLTVETLNKGCSDKSEEEMKTLQEDMAEELDNDKRAQLSSIMSQLLNMKKFISKLFLMKV